MSTHAYVGTYVPFVSVSSELWYLSKFNKPGLQFY